MLEAGSIMSENNDGVQKKSMIRIKGQKVTQADYRGLLSLALLLMFGYSMFTDNEVAAVVFGPFMGVIVGYYFHDKALSKKSLEEI